MTGVDGTDLEEFARGGSAAAFERLARRHAGFVYGICLRRLSRAADAEDAAQAVFMALARKAGSVRPERLASWLHGAALKASLLVARTVRTRARREEEAARMQSAKVEWESPREAVEPHLDAEIERLPARLREAVLRHFVGGLSHAELAAELGVPRSTTATRVQTGIERLRQRLANRGVTFGMTSLATLLAGTAASAAPASLCASLPALCTGSSVASAAAGSGAEALAEGMLKMMFWMKVKTAAVVVGVVAVLGAGGGFAFNLTATGRVAPPSDPAPAQNKGAALNPQVAGMGDNTWIKLATPAVHPVTRSSSPWMPYAPEADVALLWGTIHSGADNDVWTYSLARNEWKEMLKTEASAAKDPGVIKIKDGVLMTREERPLSYHQWGKMDYDPDRQVLWHAGTGGWQGLYSPVSQLKQAGKTVREEGDPEKAAKAGLNGKMLWRYSLKENKWSVVFTKDPSGCTRNRNSVGIRYFPPLRKLIMTPNGVGPNEASGDYRTYDPDTNTWEPLKIAWNPGKGFEYFQWSTKPVVYDSKRKAFVVIGDGTWILDPVKKTMDQVVTPEKSLVGNLDGPVGVYVHDSANATTLGIFVNYSAYGCGKNLESRGFPTDMTHVWALDVEKKAWVMQPKPADGVVPPANPQRSSTHHFYDPVRNATMVFVGGYTASGGETWVYRYKRARGK